MKFWFRSLLKKKCFRKIINKSFFKLGARKLHFPKYKKFFPEWVFLFSERGKFSPEL